MGFKSKEAVVYYYICDNCGAESPYSTLDRDDATYMADSEGFDTDSEETLCNECIEAQIRGESTGLDWKR